MPYMRDYAKLADAVEYVMSSCSIDEGQAQADICGALADRKIDIRVTIDRADPSYGGRTLAAGNVSVPLHLAPDLLDWTASRPRDPWQVGPDQRNPAERYFSMAAWKPRAISLIELRAEDVESVLCRNVVGGGKGICPSSAGGRPTDRDRVVAEAERRLRRRDYQRPPSLAAFAKELHDWLDGQPRAIRISKTGAVMQAETIEGHVRDIWNKHPNG
jgi:hypothetical protein